ncbi:hypothetical protein FKM82_023741 [Ascaphus truei]
MDTLPYNRTEAQSSLQRHRLTPEGHTYTHTRTEAQLSLLCYCLRITTPQEARQLSWGLIGGEHQHSGELEQGRG